MISDEQSGVGHVATAGLVACATAFVYLLVKGYQARLTFYLLRQQADAAVEFRPRTSPCRAASYENAA
ncbi:hypothetical protein F4806DRAFT_90425 [Annulohypoxylon nitens]|nr:hypothetical protein F4806DRAFT_90425 [Annulohypoxylon nitens]